VHMATDFNYNISNNIQILQANISHQNPTYSEQQSPNVAIARLSFLLHVKSPLIMLFKHLLLQGPRPSLLFTLLNLCISITTSKAERLELATYVNFQLASSKIERLIKISHSSTSYILFPSLMTPCVIRKWV